MATILTAESIITMDAARPRAQAVAIDEVTGIIQAVGSLAECQGAAPTAAVTDLGAGVLLPGFVEAHSHPLLAGLATQPPSHWIAPYVGYPGFGDVEKLFAELQEQTEAGQALLFVGLDRTLQEVAELSAQQLDGYFPDRPVGVLDNSGHEVYFNTATMAALGWEGARPPADPVGSSWGRNDDGTSNGRGYEMGTVMTVTGALLKQVVEHPLQSIAKWYELMARNGITATAELTYSSWMLASYEALASATSCPLRLSLYHMTTEQDCSEPLKSSTPSDVLRKQGLKLWADGSPWVGSIASSFAYLDNETTRRASIPLGPSGETMMNYTRIELDAILDKHAPEGWQLAFHVNGDVGLDIVLDAYQRALEKHGLMGTDHRWRVEHCGGCRGDQFKRAADLGVAVSLAPFQFIYWGDVLDGTLFPSEIGSQWMRWGDAVRGGARVSFHNDGNVSPPLPLLNIQTAITRMTPSGQVHGANQTISLDDALKAQTIDAAYTLHREHEIGSIEVGKQADFVLLSQDPYRADPARLAEDIVVQDTWLGGQHIDLDAFLTGVKQIDPTEHAHVAARGVAGCCCCHKPTERGPASGAQEKRNQA